MGVENIPEILAALAFFGGIFVCPVVFMLLKHQRAMAELLHRRPDEPTLHRLAALEREVAELRAAHHAEIIRKDDALAPPSSTSQPT